MLFSFVGTFLSTLLEKQAFFNLYFVYKLYFALYRPIVDRQPLKKNCQLFRVVYETCSLVWVIEQIKENHLTCCYFIVLMRSLTIDFNLKLYLNFFMIFWFVVFKAVLRYIRHTIHRLTLIVYLRFNFFVELFLCISLFYKVA